MDQEGTGEAAPHALIDEIEDCAWHIIVSYVDTHPPEDALAFLRDEVARIRRREKQVRSLMPDRWRILREEGWTARAIAHQSGVSDSWVTRHAPSPAGVRPADPTRKLRAVRQQQDAPRA